MRLSILLSDYQQVVVSIHASVKDATSEYKAFGFTTAVSIHASVKDATLRFSSEGGVGEFQSTHL